MPAVFDDVSTEILDLKNKIGATILAHYYQEGEIQALADVTGDSLKLAREATKVDSPVIVGQPPAQTRRGTDDIWPRFTSNGYRSARDRRASR